MIESIYRASLIFLFDRDIRSFLALFSLLREKARSTHVSVRIARKIQQAEDAAVVTFTRALFQWRSPSHGKGDRSESFHCQGGTFGSVDRVKIVSVALKNTKIPTIAAFYFFRD